MNLYRISTPLLIRGRRHVDGIEIANRMNRNLVRGGATGNLRKVEREFNTVSAEDRALHELKIVSVDISPEPKPLTSAELRKLIALLKRAIDSKQVLVYSDAKHLESRDGMEPVLGLLSDAVDMGINGALIQINAENTAYLTQRNL